SRRVQTGIQTGVQNDDLRFLAQQTPILLVEVRVSDRAGESARAARIEPQRTARTGIALPPDRYRPFRGAGRPQQCAAIPLSESTAGPRPQRHLLGTEKDGGQRLAVLSQRLSA